MKRNSATILLTWLSALVKSRTRRLRMEFPTSGRWLRSRKGGNTVALKYFLTSRWPTEMLHKTFNTGTIPSRRELPADELPFWIWNNYTIFMKLYNHWLYPLWKIWNVYVKLANVANNYQTYLFNSFYEKIENFLWYIHAHSFIHYFLRFTINNYAIIKRWQ